MQKSIKHLLIFAFCGVVFNSCKKDFLNTTPLTTVASSETWKDAAFSEAFVNGIYFSSDGRGNRGLGNGGLDEQMLSSLSDESIFTHAGRGINTVNEGILNP